MMAQNKIVRFGPVILSSTLTNNILNPPTTTGGVGAGTPNPYLLLKHIRIVNKTGSAATFSMWIGATGANAAGTEVIGQALSVPANSAYDWYGLLTLEVADFLVGGAGTASALTFEAEGEMGFR
jgi:hypothetical protein